MNDIPKSLAGVFSNNAIAAVLTDYCIRVSHTVISDWPLCLQGCKANFGRFHSLFPSSRTRIFGAQGDC
jgi:hypothetical protein